MNRVVPNHSLTRSLCVVVGLFAPLLVSTPAPTAELTDVIDAFDGKDKFDFDLGISFIHELHRAKVVREGAICRERDIMGNCLDYRVTSFNDLRWERITNGILISPRVGLAPDLNLIVDIPIWFSDVSRLRANSINGCDGGACTPIARTSLERDGILNDLTTNGSGTIVGGPGGRAEKKRSGIGDLFVGLELGLFNQDRDPSKAFWTIGVGSYLPSGSIMKVDNDALGRGLFGLTAWSSFSRRFRYLEPYAGIRYKVEIPTKNSLFTTTHFSNSGQRTWFPGHGGEILGGVEIIPWEDEDKGHKVAIDVGFNIRYISEGRGYSELFDFIGETDPCDSYALAGPVRSGADLYDGATYTRRDPTLCASADDPAMVMNPLPTPEPFSGMTDIEQHLEYDVHAGFVFHLTDHAMLKLTVSFRHVQEHFLTFGDAGIDSADPGGVVDSCAPADWDGGARDGYFHDDTNGNGVVDDGETVREAYECNPNFQPVFDLPGRRVRTEEKSIFTTMLTAVVRF